MKVFSADDQRFMANALELAHQAGLQDEVPVGAVLVKDNAIIATGYNAPIKNHDATAHAEIIAIRAACRVMGNYRLPETTLYLTLEPCAMCAGAIVHARISRVVCAAKEPRAGAGGSVVNLLQHPQMNHRCELDYGLYEDQSSLLLKSFFKSKRLKK